MKTFLRKNRKKILIYLIGFLILTTILYITILRHPGYIYFWDLSGAFDFRDPFGQYFKIYTPWDEVSIGIKNRMPLVSLIYLIFLPIKYIFGAGNEVVIKIAVYLLFIGSYTVMYFLFPKFIEIFCKKSTEKQSGIYIWTLIIALLYCFIPFFTYRFAQLNIFYMSVFYPLHVYLFVKLINEKKVSWKYIGLFILSMFFGLTSPNIIIFDLITFVIFFIVKIVQLRKTPKVIFKIILNILITLIGVIIVNLYWLVPYMIEGSPAPGYVITQSIVDMLSQGVSLPNFLLGQAEWFVNQGNLGVLETKNSSISIVQILGCAMFYFIGIVTLFKYMKKEYRTPILILLLIGPVLVLDFIPFHDEIFQYLLFSKFGWVFREINRLSFFWYFWMYILFALGAYAIYEEILLEGIFKKVMKIAVLPIIFVPFIIYIFPVNVQFFKYLKPVEVSEDIKEVFSVLEKDDDFYSVYYYPSIEPYSIDWMDDRFEIADSVDYLSLVYNSPKPSVYNSSVIANAKSYQTLMTEYLVDNKEEFESISENFNDLGIKYIVLRKDAEPITLEEDYFYDEILAPMAFYLDGENSFKLILENDNYILYKNEDFTSGVSIDKNVFYSTDSFTILENISADDQKESVVKFCNFPENEDVCYNSNTPKTFLKFEDNESFYLDFVPKDIREQYGIYVYDHVYDHKIDVDWGRGSMYDKVNGEMHNVLRNYGINAWNFDLVDKFAYSDMPIQEEGNSSTLSFSEDVKCVGKCEVYALVLNNHLGGNLVINIDSISKTLNTKSTFENFRWQYIGRIDSDGNVNVTLINENGFAAVGGILVIPQEIVSDAKKEAEQYKIIDIPIDNYVEDLPIYFYQTKITSYDYTSGLIPSLSVNIKSSESQEINIKAFNSVFLVQDPEEKFNFVLSSNYQTDLGESVFKILMISNTDILVWALFIIDFYIVILIMLLILL